LQETPSKKPRGLHLSALGRESDLTKRGRKEKSEKNGDAGSTEGGDITQHLGGGEEIIAGKGPKKARQGIGMRAREGGETERFTPPLLKKPAAEREFGGECNAHA